MHSSHHSPWNRNSLSSSWCWEFLEGPQCSSCHSINSLDVPKFSSTTFAFLCVCVCLHVIFRVCMRHSTGYQTSPSILREESEPTESGENFNRLATGSQGSPNTAGGAKRSMPPDASGSGYETIAASNSHSVAITITLRANPLTKAALNLACQYSTYFHPQHFHRLPVAVKGKKATPESTHKNPEDKYSTMKHFIIV